MYRWMGGLVVSLLGLLLTCQFVSGARFVIPERQPEVGALQNNIPDDLQIRSSVEPTDPRDMDLDSFHAWLLTLSREPPARRVRHLLGPTPPPDQRGVDYEEGCDLILYGEQDRPPLTNDVEEHIMRLLEGPSAPRRRELPVRRERRERIPEGHADRVEEALETSWPPDSYPPDGASSPPDGTSGPALSRVRAPDAMVPERLHSILRPPPTLSRSANRQPDIDQDTQQQEERPSRVSFRFMRNPSSM